MNAIVKRGTAFAITLLGSAAVHAADATWAGPYAGVHAGNVWGKADYREPADSRYDRVSYMDGFNGGFLAGYNVRRDKYVYGIEADMALGKIEVGADSNAFYNDYTAFEVKNSARLRMRLGYAADATLFFVAGGLAMAKVGVDDVEPGWGGASGNHTGWSLGAGVEHALDRNLSLRAEFLYDDYGSKSYAISGNPGYEAKVDVRAHAVRLGISYRF